MIGQKAGTKQMEKGLWCRPDIDECLLAGIDSIDEEAQD